MREVGWATMDIGTAIRIRRGKMSQTELAKSIGLKQNTISDWENGISLPTLDQVRALEDALDLPVGGLLLNAGYVETDGIEAAIRADEALGDDSVLDEEQRSSLLVTYLSFRDSHADRRRRRRR